MLGEHVAEFTQTIHGLWALFNLKLACDRVIRGLLPVAQTAALWNN